jgi:hypothetical protein
VAQVANSVLTLCLFTTRCLLRSALEMMWRSARLLRYIPTGPDSRAAWTEFQNKVEVFSLFAYIDLEIGSPSPGTSLQELVRRALQFGPYHAVWSVEGVGHYYANTRRIPGRSPDRLLQDERAKRLPTASLIPLHTGMGLSLAQSVLDSISKQPTGGTKLIDTFAQLCRNNSREGYAGAAFEALGLVARNLYPNLIPIIDSFLMTEPALLGYFWHGIGRGIYFHPTNFPPFCSTPWKAVEMCRREPPHDLGRGNALAGLVQALTLVNIRHPEIIATFLKYHGTELTQCDAIGDGLRSALVVWHNASPCDPYLHALRMHVPPRATTTLLELWNKHVTQSCDQVLSWEGLPASRRGVGELFCYPQSSGISNRP